MPEDMTPERRAKLRRARGDGYVDGSIGASFGHRLPDAADEAEREAYEIGWHVGRRDRLDIPIPGHINEVDAEEYARGLYCEEVGESLVAMGSGRRFGEDAPGRGGISEASPRAMLAREMGDVMAAIEYACLAGLVDRRRVEAQRVRKIAKLLDPASRDNMGRRLAPPPTGNDAP